MAYGAPHHNPERLANMPNGWKGIYRDTKGKLRVAGYTNTQVKAKKLALDVEAQIRSGGWFDPTAGKMTFAEYFEKEWLPTRRGRRTPLSGTALTTTPRSRRPSARSRCVTSPDE